MKLKTLDLSTNNFTGQIPFTLSYSKNLQFLYDFIHLFFCIFYHIFYINYLWRDYFVLKIVEQEG